MSTNLGDLIRRQRKAAGYTLRQLAPLIGLRSTADVSNRERGIRSDSFVPSLWIPLLSALPGLTLDAIIEASEQDAMDRRGQPGRRRRRDEDAIELAEARLILRKITGEPHGEIMPMLRGLLAMKRAALERVRGRSRG